METLENIRELTGSLSATRVAKLQSLWSGYGEIVRVALVGGPAATVIVKRVAPPTAARHPRGWHGSRSHARKLRSYEIEIAWYRDYASHCGGRLAHCYGACATEEGWLLVLEDLDAAGFDQRRHRPSEEELDRCLEWLAALHASFMGGAPEGLWEEGTYWHLATRPDEFAAMAPGPLKDTAGALDAALRGAKHRTLVHGDAKLANFCFSADGPVSAVDFQYVGGGCGMKDVAYLFSCLGGRACEKHAERWLDAYFDHLRAALGDETAGAAIEAEWRALYPIAWADFERFLAGWAPEHGKRDGYARAMTQQALASL